LRILYDLYLVEFRPWRIVGCIAAWKLSPGLITQIC
jgi:hypothetical protein